MLQSLVKRIARFRAQRRQALEDRMQKRDSYFAAMERTLQELADRVLTSGEEIDASKRVALSGLRHNWDRMYEAAQALPDGEEKQRILEALNKQETAILRLEQVAASSR